MEHSTPNIFPSPIINVNFINVSAEVLRYNANFGEIIRILLQRYPIRSDWANTFLDLSCVGNANMSTYLANLVKKGVFLKVIYNGHLPPILYIMICIIHKPNNYKFCHIIDSTFEQAAVQCIYDTAMARYENCVSEDIKCPVCHDVISINNPKPFVVMNKCFHLICLYCYHRMITDSDIELGLASCSLCRANTFITYSIECCVNSIVKFFS